MTDVIFAIPGDLQTPTGGYAYDRQVLARLPAHGVAVRHLALPGAFPAPSADDLAETLRLMQGLPGNAIVLIDGLAYGALPPAVIAQIERPLVALVHHPLGLESGISPQDARHLIQNETSALAHAAAVVVTSPTTARLLVADFDVPPERIHVAVPGTEPASRARGSGSGVHLLAVGSIVPRKGYDVLVEALSGLSAKDWKMTIVGADDRSPVHVADIRHRIATSGVAERITLTGAVGEEALNGHYDAADIFVLASHFEGFGMVLTEALARGLPIITTTGGAAAETISDKASIKVPPADVAALRDAINRLIGDAVERQRLSDVAWAETQTLSRWEDTARLIATALKGLGA